MVVMRSRSAASLSSSARRAAARRSTSAELGPQYRLWEVRRTSDQPICRRTAVIRVWLLWSWRAVSIPSSSAIWATVTSSKRLVNDSIGSDHLNPPRFDHRVADDHA